MNLDINGKKDMLISAVHPTLVLSGFDFSNTYKKYTEGKYSNLTLKQIKSSRPVIQSSFKKIEAVTNDDSKVRYMISDNRGVNVTFINVKNTSKICQWCRRQIPHDHDKISIPLSIQPTTDNTSTVFAGHGTYCTFECAYSDINRTYKRDIRFKDSGIYLNFIYQRFYPNTMLQQAPDFILHECNGGPISDKEFHSNSHKYSSTGRYRILDTSPSYIVR